MNILYRVLVSALMAASLLPSFAGGAGWNVVVIANQASSNSLALAADYAHRREVPPENILRISWPGSSVAWSLDDLQAYLLNPLQIMLTERQLTGQVHYAVLSMDIPYRVENGTNPFTAGHNSTTSVLFYGFKPDGTNDQYGPVSCSLPDDSTNTYAGTEAPFRLTAQGQGAGLLAMMLTSSNLVQARAIIDRAIASDASFPTQQALLVKGTDWARNVRHIAFDSAIFDARIRKNYDLRRIDANVVDGFTNILGLALGQETYLVSHGSFVPGAIADNMTSFGGQIFEPSGQTPLLDLLNAGATASYGTVAEPCNHLGKFPSAYTWFYQARGFNIAEAIYMGTTNPHQGLLVGEPLAAPFAQPGRGDWLAQTNLSGTVALPFVFAAHSADQPLTQVDLLVDGRLFTTITNIPPAQGNALLVTINGHPISYTIPADASPGSIASGLAQEINTSANQVVTRVMANAIGDRLELQSQDTQRPGAGVSLQVNSAAGSAPFVSTHLRTPAGTFLDTIAHGARTVFVANASQVGDFLALQIALTNGIERTLGVTNSGSSGLRTMLQSLVDLVNTEAAFAGPDGIVAEDLVAQEGARPEGEFRLRARLPGIAAAGIRVTLLGSSTFTRVPSGTVNLRQNIADLHPRQHIYVSSGLPVLEGEATIDTTGIPDGVHEFIAVAYEGTHVRIQTRASMQVNVKNTPIMGTLQRLSGSLAPPGSQVRLRVEASGAPVQRIELFTTGGLAGIATNVSSADFELSADWLGAGVHPFYALVTTSLGSFRTSAQRIVVTAPFEISVRTGPGVVLEWPAIPGGRYEVLSGNHSLGITNSLATLQANTSIGRWSGPTPTTVPALYRVRFIE